MQVLNNVQTYLLETSPDDTDSLNALTTIYDILVLCFGLDEDDLHNNTEVCRYKIVTIVSKLLIVL